MKVSSTLRRLAYAVIAVAALIGTWSNNLAYLHLGPIGGTLQFWKETLVNPASRSITVDISFLFLAIAVWMILEARRLQIRYVWIYIVLGVIVAISVTFPMFMISRERVISSQGTEDSAGYMNRSDLIGLLVLAAGFVAYATLTLLA
jgi:hypothetical protein